MRCHEEALLRAEVLAPGPDQLAACAREMFLGEVMRGGGKAPGHPLIRAEGRDVGQGENKMKSAM